jgi:hypothetical protein
MAVLRQASALLLVEAARGTAGPCKEAARVVEAV